MTVRDLGIHQDTLMDTHLSQLVSSCFGILRQIRCIRRSLPHSSLATLMAEFIWSKVDYCNVLLAGLPRRDLDRLQSVTNAAARLMTGAHRYDHIMLLLKDLTLVACTWANYIQVVRSHLQLPAWFSTTLPTRSHSADVDCGHHPRLPCWCWCPSTHRTWWLSICRRWASCLEYPTRLHHRLFTIAHFQTISQDLSIQSIIFTPRALRS